MRDRQAKVCFKTFHTRYGVQSIDQLSCLLKEELSFPNHGEKRPKPLLISRPLAPSTKLNTFDKTNTRSVRFRSWAWPRFLEVGDVDQPGLLWKTVDHSVCF